MAVDAGVATACYSGPVTGIMEILIDLHTWQQTYHAETGGITNVWRTQLAFGGGRNLTEHIMFY